MEEDARRRMMEEGWKENSNVYQIRVEVKTVIVVLFYSYYSVLLWCYCTLLYIIHDCIFEDRRVYSRYRVRTARYT